MSHRQGQCTTRCPMACLGLSGGAYEALRRTGKVRTIGDVLSLVAAGELQGVYRIGVMRVEEITIALVAVGFSKHDLVRTALVDVVGGHVRCQQEGCMSGAVFRIDRTPPEETRMACALHACTTLLVLSEDGYQIRCSDEALATLPR